jgi:hypothetical protein
MNDHEPAPGGRVFPFLHAGGLVGDHAHVGAAGIRITEEPRRESYGAVVVFLDRYGNKQDLIERAGRRAPRIRPSDGFPAAWKTGAAAG